jgi:hypothetical protein
MPTPVVQTDVELAREFFRNLNETGLQLPLAKEQS